MKKKDANRRRGSPLRSAVIILIIAVVVVLGIECYREWKNYERTARYYAGAYFLEVLVIEDYWIWKYSASPIDLQALVNDLNLIPPSNPYRRDRKTIFTTIDKRIPGAIWYIPGPLEEPDFWAFGLFLSSRSGTADFMTEGDDPWLVGWMFSKPDGVPDGIIAGLFYNTGCYGGNMPEEGLSRLWELRLKGDSHWRYSDGSIVDFYSERYQTLADDYYQKHPENFAAGKRPRMPKGYTISKEDADRAFVDVTAWELYKKLYGYDPVIGGEKTKK